MTAVLGINCVYHESAAALVVDGDIVAACEEERFNRFKHGKRADVDSPAELPIAAISHCLAIAGMDASDLDCVALSFSPALRRAAFAPDPDAAPGDWGSVEGEATFAKFLAETPATVRRLLGPGFRRAVREIPHHLCHAASAYYPSGFDRAAILVADGIAEGAATVLFEGRGSNLIELETFDYPQSIGFLWEKLSKFLGFSEYDACKTMGLAAYGNADRLRPAFERLATTEAGGSYRIDGAIAQFRADGFDSLASLFGPPRRPNQPLKQRHYDLAASLQEFTTEVMCGLARRLNGLTGATRLCLAGGVALNCVANAAIHRLGIFEDIYVPPAPHDAGTAVGAALHACHRLKPGLAPRSVSTPYLGPEFANGTIARALDGIGTSAGTIEETIERVANIIADGQIVAWFQGRMEFGPRALGNRSLLADPRRADMRDILNRKVKHREDFRPFAPSVLAERASDWFEIDALTLSHGYMLYTVAARPERKGAIPAVIHHDGSSRVQIVTREMNPVYHGLISAFERRTGVPMLLNTSFNDSEPIVCSPADALATFRKTRIDALVLGDRWIERADVEILAA